MPMTVRLFATLKDRAGSGQVTVAVEPPLRVGDLLAALTEAYPALTPALPMTLVAVNLAYADQDTLLQPGDEVALFPPVSGG